jgi:uncharacterized membrane protein
MATDERDLSLLVPGPIRRLPADLAAVVLWVVATNLAVFLPVVSETPLRIVLGLPFVLFVPGYALIAALFPEEGEGMLHDDVVESEEADGEDGEDEDSVGIGNRVAGDRQGIDGIERVALSFGLSIAVVPLTGLVLNFTPWGIRLAPIMVSLSALTLGLTWIGAVRRWDLPPDERFAVPYRAWLAAGRSELFEPDSRADAALNVLLAASVVLAAASVGYAVAVPKQGESFSEFYLLTETDEGDLVADGYPTNMTAGESSELVVGIGNQEHATETYTVVVQLQRVRTVNASNGTVEVIERERLDRMEATLGHNETWLQPHTVTPTMTGDNLRVKYFLYRGDPPAEVSADTAYRDLHLWVNVSEPAR